MNYLVQKVNKPLHIAVEVPGSKSITNRALLIGAMADGLSEIQGILFSDDSRFFLKALQELGFEINISEEKKTVRIQGMNGRIPKKEATIQVGSAGTAARFLTAFLAMSDGTYQIDLIEGDGSNFWNGGMHKAIEHIKNTHMDYDYYMLMNDDTKFFPGIFDEMAPHLKKDEVTVGAICGENGGLSYGGIKYTKGIKYKKLGPDAPEVNCDTFNANCAIIPREIFEKVGIDPFYQHSIGDFDYGLQISKLGYKIHIYPKFVGECNDNTLQKTWQDETLPRMERIRLKESRKGLPFRDWFHFLHKNFGLGTAIVRSITPYIRIILGTKTRYSGA